MATAPPKSLTNTTSVPPITITSAAALPPVQPANGTCATRCAFKYGGTGNTFRYDLESAHLGDGSGLPSNANLLKGLSVCVPCDYSISGGADAKPTSYGAMVCAGLFKNPVRFFLNDLCVRPPAGTSSSSSPTSARSRATPCTPATWRSSPPSRPRSPSF